MNALIDKFPTAVTIDGKAVEINTDFRVALKVLGAFSDGELNQQEKAEVLLRLLYPAPPINPLKAVKQGMKWLNLGVEAEISDEPPIYDFEKDGKYIYTAFQSSYNIDLESVDYLHWWKFRALFSDLGECFFSHLVGIRSRMRTGELMEHERKFVAKNIDIIELEEAGESAADEFLKMWGDNENG